MFLLGQDLVHLVELSTFLQLWGQPDFHWVTSERSEEGLIEDQMDLPGGGEDKSVSGGANLFRDREWANGFWSELWSRESERKILGVEVDEVLGLIIIWFTYMLVICVLVLSLCLQQNLPEFLLGLPEV